MGGLAVAVDWSERPDPSAFAPMVEAMGHRGRAGIRTAEAGAALLAEARLPRDGTEGWRIATAGPLTLVGDLRLWHLDALRSLAGIDDADPRMLALHAWAAHGAAMMDAVDGDFAFAIWDADTSTLFAARDRFGAKPLWIQQTPGGIRLASGTGQLVAATDPRPGPDPVTVERFLRDEIAYDDRSFHEGIRRLMPAHHLVATADGVTTTRYWNPSEIPERPATDVPATFRRLVVDAVADRLAGSMRTVSDLSGADTHRSPPPPTTSSPIASTPGGSSPCRRSSPARRPTSRHGSPRRSRPSRSPTATTRWASGTSTTTPPTWPRPACPSPTTSGTSWYVPRRSP